MDHDCVGSMASVPRFVETPSIPWREFSEERIFPLEIGFLMIAFCCFSAAREKYA